MKETVSVEWLRKNLHNENLILLDSSLQKAADGSISKPNNISIPNARYIDLNNTFSDARSSFPNTLPSPEQFEVECQKLGINNSSKIVVFDNKGIYSSPRVWWMFKIMGHENIAVLDGGLPEWINKGYSFEALIFKNFEPGNFKATYNKQYLKTYNDVLQNIESKTFTLVDARSEGRFNGIEPEPRKHLKSGHVPNSINIPLEQVLANGKFKPVAELKEIFGNKIASESEIAFSCGSGITACIVMLACEISFKKSKYIYDGSWTEWAELQGLKV